MIYIYEPNLYSHVVSSPNSSGLQGSVDTRYNVLSKSHMYMAYKPQTRQADSDTVIFHGTDYLNDDSRIFKKHLNFLHFHITDGFLIWIPGNKLM